MFSVRNASAGLEVLQAREVRKGRRVRGLDPATEMLGQLLWEQQQTNRLLWATLTPEQKQEASRR